MMENKEVSRYSWYRTLGLHETANIIYNVELDQRLYVVWRSRG